MYKYIFKFRAILMGLFLFIFCLGINSASSAPSLAASLAGRILLQVEENGEAWYVIPKEKEMVYMKDGAVAYQIMRELSLGITDANLAKIPVGIEARFNDNDTDGDGLSDRLEEGLGTNLNNADTDGDGFNDGQEIKSNYNPLNKNKLVYDQALVNRLKGYILLQTEKQGQAWYVNPADGRRYYMESGAAAYKIMRFLSLGITNKNLSLIPKSSRVFKLDNSGNSSNQGNQGNNNSTSTPPGNNGNQGGNSGGGGGGGGVGSSNPPTPSNDQDNDGYKTNGSGALDCNDNNPSINPGATEICGNNVDEDCSGADLQCVVPDYDIDNDGYDTIASGGTDCNDNNANVNPGKTEVLGNNIDDNCNNQIDETSTPVIDNSAPSVPANLSGTTSGTQVVLTWTQSTDNIGVYQYDIERQLSVITGYQNIASVNATTYTNINLEPGGVYTYRVKARDLAGNSSLYSNSFTITVNAAPDTSAPSAPTNLAGTATTNQVSLTWSASSDNVGVVQYHIEMSTSSSNFAQIAIVSNTSYTNINLDPNTTYYYRVRARDAALWYSPFSQVFSIATLADTQAPTIPANLTASISGTQVSLSWAASTDIIGVTGYQVLRSSTNGGPYSLVATSNITSYTQTNIPAGTYYYVVKAYDAAGNISNNSNQATAQISGGDTSCTPITISNLTSNIGTSNPQTTASVTATNGSVMYLTVGLAFMPVSFPTDSITISGLGATWTKVSTNTYGYRRRVWLFKGVGGSGTGPVTINYTGANASSFQEIGWVLDQATGLNLTTPNDSVVTTETAGVSPSSLTVSTSDTPGTCDVTYSSLVLENQKTTNIEAGWSSLGQTSTGSLGVRKVASAWDDARDTSHTWSWTDGSYAAAFITILNNGSSVQPPVGDQTAPTAPTNLSATVSGTQISLNWTASSDNVGVSQYRIETANGGAYSLAGTSNSTSYTISNLLANTTYSCRVQAQDAAGLMSPYSNIVTVTTGGSSPASNVSISGVNDNTISHDQAITISGSGFGTKVAVEVAANQLVVGPPVLWDNFEDGVNGQLVQPSASKWDRVRSDNLSGPRYYTGAIDNSMGVRTGSGIYEGVTAGHTRTLMEDDEFRHLYLDYYIRAYKGEGLKQRSSKQVMIWTANVGISEDGPNTLFWQITQGGEEPPFALGQYVCGNDPWINTYGNGWGVDEFTTARHVQIEYRQPSAIGVNDGHVRVWYDGVLVTDQIPFGSPSCDPDKNYLDNLFIGHFQDVDSAIEPQWKWITCPGDALCSANPTCVGGCSVENPNWLPARQDEFFYDNIYIDKSIARVEIGNASTYAASTRREIQVPSSWGNSIQITVNKGGFSSGQTAYLYVVDSSGNVNSSGYPITFN